MDATAPSELRQERLAEFWNAAVSCFLATKHRLMEILAMLLVVAQARLRQQNHLRGNKPTRTRCGSNAGGGNRSSTTNL